MVRVSGDLGQPVVLGVNASGGFEGDVEISKVVWSVRNPWQR